MTPNAADEEGLRPPEHARVARQRPERLAVDAPREEAIRFRGVTREDLAELVARQVLRIGGEELPRA